MHTNNTQIKEIIFQIYIIIILLVTTFIAVENALSNARIIDFVSTYTAIKLIIAGEGHHLYNFSVQSIFQQQLLEPFVAFNGLLPYITPPFYIIPFLWLEHLPLPWALTMMNLINIMFIIVTVKILRSYLQGLATLNYTVLIVTACFFPPFYINLLQGQNASISLIVLTGSYLLLKQGRETSAGCILALGLFKPQINLLFIFILLTKKRWNAILGYIAVALVQLTASYILVGKTGLEDYAKLTITNSPLTDGHYGIYYHVMHNWRGFFTSLMGNNYNKLTVLLIVCASLSSLTALMWSWRGKWDPSGIKFDLQFSLLIIVSLLVSPHLNTHDLTLLLLPAVLIINILKLNVNLNHSQQLLIAIIILAGWLITGLTINFLGNMRVQPTVLYMIISAILLIYSIEKTKIVSIINGKYDSLA